MNNWLLISLPIGESDMSKIGWNPNFKAILHQNKNLIGGRCSGTEASFLHLMLANQLGFYTQINTEILTIADAIDEFNMIFGLFSY